jgi:hydroxyacylglutathione hydrolase
LNTFGKKFSASSWCDYNMRCASKQILPNSIDKRDGCFYNPNAWGDAMMLETLVVGPLAVNCYVLGDEKTREGIVIDPGDDARRIIDTIKTLQLKVVAIVNTHAHFDHVGALNEVREYTGAPFMLHAAEVPVLENAAASAAAFQIRIPAPKPADRLLQEGDEIAAGSVVLKVLHTPGHTPGGICLLAGSHVFVGDTLFQGSIGRYDFPGGDYGTLMGSIRDKLLPLPDETIVHPGHGPATTMGAEKQLNPFLRPLITGRWNV